MTTEFVNPYSGHVKLALIDPSLIDDIQCDPENIERQLRCHRRPLTRVQQGPSATATTEPFPNTPAQLGALPSGSRDLRIPPTVDEGQWFDMPDEVMHFTVNKVSNAKRGKSDLATLLPWLRRYKDWLIDRVRINKYKSAFLWDVTLTGANRQAIDAKMMEYARPPEPGSVLIHNESEEWKAVQPMIDAGNVAADGLAIKLMVAMGAGLPEHYLSEGGDVNRATAAEMGLPVLKKYQRRQDVLRFILSSLIDRVIDEAQKAGTLPRTIDTGYAIVFPDLKAEATKDIGTAAWHMSSALQTGMQLGLVSRETASAIFFQSCRMEVDHNEEWDRIDGDKREMATAGGSAASGHPLGTHPMNQAAAGATPPANRSQTSPGNDDNPARTNGSAKPTPLTRSAS